MTSDTQARRDLLRLNVLEGARRKMVANDERWGLDRTLTPFLWNAVMLEEAGEVCQELYLQVKTEEDDTLRDELVDLASVALAMIEAIDDRRWVPVRTEDANVAMASVAAIGRALGSHARTVLERGTEREVLTSLNNIAFVINNDVSELLAVGYTPRAIEGEDDQEAQGDEAPDTV